VNGPPSTRADAPHSTVNSVPPSVTRERITTSAVESSDIAAPVGLPHGE
jgi:hypothetical protein